MFNRWRSIAAQQQALLNKVTQPAARAYLTTPLPVKETALQDIQFLALDFETTGLNPRSDAILSMGYTRLHNGRITLRDSAYHLIRLDNALPQAGVRIHQITDDGMQQGIALAAALDQLLLHMCGRVLLVHYAGIERYFLQAAMRQVYGYALPFLLVDTMQLEQRMLARAQRPVAENQLRLANLRTQYRLPRYGAHNALEDALATAELFLAQCAQLTSQNEGLLLRNVLS